MAEVLGLGRAADIWCRGLRLFPNISVRRRKGGRGKGDNKTTFGEDGSQTGDKGLWMSVWVDDVDAVHTQCVELGLDVTWPPTDMPWNVREMHLRHPDGHVFRISCGIKES